ALNGPNVLSKELHGHTLNAIGNLRTDNPILAALDGIPIDPTVPCHSIIPLIGGVTNTDGVVEYRSSHLGGAAAERIVAGTHFSQESPEVTRELRRILLEHLATNRSQEILQASGWRKMPETRSPGRLPASKQHCQLRPAPSEQTPPR